MPAVVPTNVDLEPAEYRQGKNLLVVWRVTTACNLGCRFCGYRKGAAIPRQSAVPSAVLSFAAALADYRRITGDSVRVSWLGGEPFLWKPLHHVSRRMAHEYGLSLSATTNGTALGTAAVVRTLRDCFDDLHVSVDGLGRSHDRSRQRAGLYEALLVAISALTSCTPCPRVGVNLLLTAESIVAFESVCSQLGDAGVSFLTFNPLIADPTSPAASRMLTANHLPLLDEIEVTREALRARTGVTVRGGPAYFDRVRAYVRKERVAVEDCSPGHSRLLIDDTGRVVPCSSVSVPAEPVFVGDLRSAADIQRLGSIFSTSIKRCRPSACMDCMEPFVYGKFDEVPC